MYDGVILDEDGVIIESNIDNFRWMDRARIDAANQLGYDFDYEDSRKIVLSNSVQEISKFLDRRDLTWTDLEMIEEKVQLKKVELLRNQEIQLYPGLREVLRSLDELAVASNAPMETTQFALKFFRIRHDFKTVQAPMMKDIRKYFTNKKPDPTLIEKVMQDTGWENPLMVGDTGTDIMAARKAGIDVARVETNAMKVEEEPDYILDSVQEVVDLVREHE